MTYKKLIKKLDKMIEDNKKFITHIKSQPKGRYDEYYATPKH